VQPLMSLRYTAGFGGHLLDWLQRGDLDMAILYDPRPLKSVTRRPLVTEQLFAVGGVEKKYRMDRPIRLQDLQGEPLVLPSSRHSLRALIDLSGVEMNAKFEVEALVTIKDLVMGGLGTSFLPMSYIKRDIAAGRLTAAPIVEPRLVRTIYVASATDKVTSPETEICERVLIQLFERMVVGGEWPYAELVADKTPISA
jgi:DNA-binding transcriptional LysR family regulator